MKKWLKQLRAAYKTRAWSVGAYSVLAAVLVIAIGVVINLAVEALPSSVTEVDMTPEQLYSISPETEQILSALEEDVDIYWLVSSGSEDDTLRRVLEKYGEFDRVTVTQVDPVEYPAFAGAYTSESVTMNSLIVTNGERSMYIPYSDIWTYSDYEMYYYYYYYYGQEYLDTFAGEGQLTSAVSYVTAEELPVMYILSGHGETELSQDVLSAVALENVETEALNLLTVEAVPEDCGVLAVFGPVSDLSESECEKIRAYLNGGGRMLVTTEYTEESMVNFQALLREYGLELSYGYVLENNSAYYSFGYIDLLLPELVSHSITAPLVNGGYSVMMPDAQAITETEEHGDNIQVSRLLETSATSYLKESISGLASYDQTDADPVGPFMVAAAAEDTDTGAQLVVFGSTVFMEAEYSDMVSGSGEDLFLNALAWLCEMEQSISIHPKTLSGDTLVFSGRAAGVLKTLFVIVMPLLCVGAGVVNFVRRRKR